MESLRVARYRKRPVEIEAVQWTGNMAPIIALVGHDLPTFGPEGQSGSLRIASLEGDHECRLGDWVIKGVIGELYACKPDVFALTYENVCDGSVTCPAPLHIHGCYADSGSCDEPDEHS